jgi:hypothetical protein
MAPKSRKFFENGGNQMYTAFQVHFGPSELDEGVVEITRRRLEN